MNIDANLNRIKLQNDNKKLNDVILFQWRMINTKDLNQDTINRMLQSICLCLQQIHINNVLIHDYTI